MSGSNMEVETGPPSKADATKKAPPHSDEERGFTEQELEICTRILSSFSGKDSTNKQHLMHGVYRDLRKTAIKFNEEIERNMYHGLTAREYDRRKIRTKWKNSERTRLKDLDRKRIDQANLRAERLSMLKSLCEPGHSTPIMITDKGGAIDNLSGVSLCIENGSKTGEDEKQQDNQLVPLHKANSRKDLKSPTVRKADCLSDLIESKVPHEADIKAVKRELENKHLSTKPGRRKRRKGNRVTIEDYKSSDEENEDTLNYARSCYICKARFLKLHHFYDQLCPSCAALNWEKRNQMADLTGKVIIVTGARVKIGYEACLRLLRCGATVIATTRFPHDAAKRFSQVDGFDSFSSRLHIFGLDLRDLRAVVRFTDIVCEQYDRLDAIVNNAAQTIRRPPAYYSHMMKDELIPTEALPPKLQPLIMEDPHVDPNDPTPRYTRLSQGFIPSGKKKSSVTIEHIDEDGEDQIASSGSGKAGKVEEAEAEAEAEAGTGTGTDEHVEEDENFSLKPEGPSSRSDAIMSNVLDTMTHDRNYIVGNRSALMSQMSLIAGDDVHDKKLFPQGKLDVTGQQLDLRHVNSWLLTLDQVEPSELVEVFAVNALSPFILNSRLKRLMNKTSDASWIINVSAMEGKFYRYKNCNHPHTNMAKAALNMMTRTSAQQYARDSIYMNSVDTGWINDENPFEKSKEIAENNNFQTPIDEMDAMARILDPILVGARTGINTFGQFYKDYRPSEW